MLSRIIFSIFTLIFLFFYSSEAQNYDWLDIPFDKINDQSYENALTGGLTAAQFNEIDIDLDGVKDLLIFDRDGAVLLPMLYKDGKYDFHPEYRAFFPPIKNWIRCRDMNHDGIMDIFCYNIEAPLNGVEVYIGSIEDNHLKYDKIQFTEGAYEVLYYNLGNQIFNMDVISSDVPDVIDVDGDGDLDIITFNPNDGYVFYYKNTNIENGESLDYPKFELVDACWGRFYESGFNEEIYLSETSTKCYGEFKDDTEVENKSGLHAGSTLSLFDQNADGVYEIFIGDLTSEHLVFMLNGGTKESAYMVEADTQFPNYGQKIEFPVFLMPNMIDVDRDGHLDLLVTPNTIGGVVNQENVFYYKNDGNSSDVKFEYQTNDLFVNEMFDTGSLSAPAFCDYNQDGLLDIVVGTFGVYNPTGSPQSRLILLKNVGTATAPKYQVVDQDYLKYSNYTSDYYTFSPHFGDLDGDGDDDLIVGTNRGELIYQENIANAGSTYEFNSPIFNYMSIDVGDNIDPTMVDLNRDGLMDLVVGEKNQNKNPHTNALGNLNYFQNVGSIGAPLFGSDEKVKPNDNTLGEVIVKGVFGASGSATPAFYDTGDKLVLWVGSENGDVHFYDNIIDNLYGAFNEVDAQVGNISEGSRSNVTIADIDGDDILELVTGVSRGGLIFFKTNITTEAMVPITNQDDLSFQIFPNPAKGLLIIEGLEENTDCTILNMLGQKVLHIKVKDVIDISKLNSGQYFISLKNSQGDFAIRTFIKL